MKENKNLNFAFFGTDTFSILVLEQLKSAGFLPKLIITVLDKPKGRKLILTPPETKVWAEENNVKYIQPKSLREDKNPGIVDEIKSYCTKGFDLFIVASYGKIIPQAILDIPKFKTLNVHPSLLPKLRGPSPIISAILSENETGVTIMRLDSDMDHGPIIVQKKVEISEWPPYAETLENILGTEGGKILAQIIPNWIDGKIPEIEQDHSLATICKKVEKTDGEINLTDSAEINLRKIRAFHVWPTAYYFISRPSRTQDGLGQDNPTSPGLPDDRTRTTRVIIKKAHIENRELIIERVIPEGKKEMNYEDFKKGLR